MYTVQDICITAACILSEKNIQLLLLDSGNYYLITHKLWLEDPLKWHVHEISGSCLVADIYYSRDKFCVQNHRDAN